MQATPPFMSQAPRPCTVPSATTAAKGRCSQRSTRLDVDDVDMPVEEQDAAAAAAREARDELRAPRKGEARRHHRVSGEQPRIGLGNVDRGAGASQPLGEEGLQRRLLARGRARDVGRRVEADQRLEQRHEVVLAIGDPFADPSSSSAVMAACIVSIRGPQNATT